MEAHDVVIDGGIWMKLAMVEHAGLHPAQGVSIFYVSRQQDAVGIGNQTEGRGSRKLSRAKLLRAQ